MTTWPRGIFVVGTDTGVGKTWVAAAIARAWVRAGHRVGVFKPVSTGGVDRDGMLSSPDADALIAAITTEGSSFPPPPHDRVAPLIYRLPVAPPLAARRAGTPLEPAAVVRAVESAVAWWVDVARADLVVVEGVGGLLCPVAEGGWTVADLAAHLDYPLVVVAHRGLGTLNHTLLTVEVAQSRGLRVAGVILNGARPPADPIAEDSNAGELAALLPFTMLLADWTHDPTPTGTPEIHAAANWVELAQVPRITPGPSVGTPPTRTTAAATGPSVLMSSSDDDLNGGSMFGSLGADTPPSGVIGLNLDLGPARRSASERSAVVEEDGDKPTPDPSSWRNVLLASYASAMTLVLVWMLAGGRTAPKVNWSRPTVDVGTSEPGEDRSRLARPLAPIPADRRINLGQSKQLGDLLIQPLKVERRNLGLERVTLAGQVEHRDGGPRAVVLAVRLQNRSRTEVFAPLDAAFVRDDGADRFDSLLELDDGRKIYPEPLALASEWHVEGESFAELRPGESREVVFATGPNAPPDIERLPGTWRIKFRTRGASTESVGIRLGGASKP